MRQLEIFNSSEFEFDVSEFYSQRTLWAINTSAGKDSQAMYIFLRNKLPKDSHIILVHAELPEVDWPGLREHIERYRYHPVFYVKGKRTFFEMVRSRGMFPSPIYRTCTSDLKSLPLNKFIKDYFHENGTFNTVINCLGLRAQESAQRKKKPQFTYNKKNSAPTKNRAWYDWLPIHQTSEREVFQTIADAGETPHYAYLHGMSRLSCSFCIMSSLSDLRQAALLRPNLYQKYCDLEQEINFAMMMPSKNKVRFLPEITGIVPRETFKEKNHEIKPIGHSQENAGNPVNLINEYEQKSITRLF